MPKARAGVYPGTFDPITLGHLDVIERSTRVVDKLVIAVGVGDGKGPLFSLADRMDMIKGDLAGIETNDAEITIQPLEGLLVDFAEEVGAQLIIRGLRAVSDFEYEFQMVGMNSRLKPEIETVFLMASDRHQFISSRLVKEVSKLGGDVSQFVTAAVAARLAATGN